METEGDNDPEATSDRLAVILFEEPRVCDTELVEIDVFDMDLLYDREMEPDVLIDLL